MEVKFSIYLNSHVFVMMKEIMGCGFRSFKVMPFVIFEIKICILLINFYTNCLILIILIWHLYHHAKQVCMKIGHVGPGFLVIFAQVYKYICVYITIFRQTFLRNYFTYILEMFSTTVGYDYVYCGKKAGLCGQVSENKVPLKFLFYKY